MYMYMYVYLFSPYLSARRSGGSFDAAAGTGQPRRDQPSMQIRPMCRHVGPIRGNPACGLHPVGVDWVQIATAHVAPRRSTPGHNQGSSASFF